MADHVVVMRAGVIEQQGQPLDLYDKPVNKFVAGFIGSPAMNFIPASGGVDGHSLVLELSGRQHVATGVPVAPGKKVTLGLRPEHVTIVPRGEGIIEVPVAIVESTGSTTYLTTATLPELVVVLNGRAHVSAGDVVGLDFASSQLHLFDAETERRL